jgi:hypothetical protein
MAHVQEQSMDRGQIFLKSPIPNVMIVRPVEAELIYAERRTDRHDEYNRGFLRYAKTPKVKAWFVTWLVACLWTMR